MNDPTLPGGDDPNTGVRSISGEEFAKRLIRQQHSTNGHTNGAPPDGRFDDDEVSFAAIKEAPLPPFDLDAEAAVIVSEIYRPESIPRIRTILDRRDFYQESHALIHDACLVLHDDGRPVDAVTVLSYLREHGTLSRVTPSYFSEVLAAAPVYINARSYAETVANLARRRNLLRICELAVSAIYESKADPTWIIENLRSHVETFKPQTAYQTPIDVLQQWQEEGPLIHEPTGIPPLDNLTGGGPVYGTRWILNGAPDAGKTAILVQIGHTYALRGVAVGFLAADEQSDDLQTRLAQRMEFSRIDCEVRHTNTLGLMKTAFAGLPVRFYRAETTIEAASDDLALWARERGCQACLIVDSIQTVTCAKAIVQADDLSTRELVTENVRAIKNCAMRHRLIVLATSEMNRAAYRNGKTADENDMASGAESRAIEYLARVLLTLRSVKGEPDLVEIALPKNKHGPSGQSFYLRIDRRRMTLFESGGPNSEGDPVATKLEERDRLREEAKKKETEEQTKKEREREARRQTRDEKDDSALLAILQAKPGLGIAELRAEMAAKLGECGRGRVETALARQAARIRVVVGPKNSRQHFLAEGGWSDAVDASDGTDTGGQ